MPMVPISPHISSSDSFPRGGRYLNYFLKPDTDVNMLLESVGKKLDADIEQVDFRDCEVRFIRYKGGLFSTNNYWHVCYITGHYTPFIILSIEAYNMYGDIKPNAFAVGYILERDFKENILPES